MGACVTGVCVVVGVGVGGRRGRRRRRAMERRFGWVLGVSRLGIDTVVK